MLTLRRGRPMTRSIYVTSVFVSASAPSRRPTLIATSLPPSSSFYSSASIVCLPCRARARAWARANAGNTLSAHRKYSAASSTSSRGQHPIATRQLSGSGLRIRAKGARSLLAWHREWLYTHGEGRRRPLQRLYSTLRPTDEDGDAVQGLDVVEESGEIEGKREGQEENEQQSAELEKPLRTEAEQIEAKVERVRNLYGNALPEGVLTAEEKLIYVRLYGVPEAYVEEAEEIEEGDLDGPSQTTLLQSTESGAYEEIDGSDNSDAVGREGTTSVPGDGSHASESAQSDGYAADELDEFDESGEGELEFPPSEQEANSAEEGEEDDYPTGELARAHSVTLAGRSRTTPSTINLSASAFVRPVAKMLSTSSNTHITETARRLLGGPALSYSPSTPSRNANAPQKPIGLNCAQPQMGQIEADAYMVAVMPGVYASTLGALVEVRRRMGEGWIEGLIARKGGPRVLDVGGGGAGALAWRDVVKAELARMKPSSAEEGEVDDSFESIGKHGKSTVLIGSDALRHRVSKLLDDSTFIPRLPERIDETAENQRRRYDVILAPHSLLPFTEEWERRRHIQTLWSLLEPDGGVLILLEKGMPRGFEAVAGARKYLLDRVISDPSSESIRLQMSEDPKAGTDAASSADTESKPVEKERGMIIAPCTNHGVCPLYKIPGFLSGRRDFCRFNQRFIRPPFLQRLRGMQSSGANHEDVNFSYVAFQRGRDMRQDVKGTLVQNAEATDRAFEGFEFEDADDATEELSLRRADNHPHPLSLPRAILPPLKRRGHVIIDVCTPSATFERWIVTRSFSRQAYRDARKSRWGDLWGLGAKSRFVKEARTRSHRDRDDGDTITASGATRNKKVKVRSERVLSRDGKRSGVIYSTPREDAGVAIPVDIDDADLDGTMSEMASSATTPSGAAQKRPQKIKAWERRAIEKRERRRGRRGLFAQRTQPDEDDDGADHERFSPVADHQNLEDDVDEDGSDLLSAIQQANYQQPRDRETDPRKRSTFVGLKHAPPPSPQFDAFGQRPPTVTTDSSNKNARHGGTPSSTRRSKHQRDDGQPTGGDRVEQWGRKGGKIAYVKGQTEEEMLRELVGGSFFSDEGLGSESARASPVRSNPHSRSRSRSRPRPRSGASRPSSSYY